MDVRIREKIVPLGSIIGEGGEARVYKLGGDMLAKVYRLPADPDLDPSQLNATRLRIVVAQKKLRLFPRDLPETVVSPLDVVKETTSGLIIGYTMPFVSGAKPLADFKSSATRSATITDRYVMDVFRGLMHTTRAIHDRATVIGDYNEANVLVRDAKAFVIDADSFQFGPYRSKVFMPAFVDPNRCDPTLPRLELAKLHDVESDWYAWWTMLFQSVMYIHPYGGVYKPADKSKGVPNAIRGLPQHRISVYDPDVKYPSQARPLNDIPEALTSYFRRVFAAGLRPEPTDALFDSLAFKADGSFDQSKVITPTVTVSGATITTSTARDSGGEILAATAIEGLPTVLEFTNGELRRDGTKVAALKSIAGADFCIAGPQTVLSTNEEALIFSPGWTSPVKAQLRRAGHLSAMVAGTTSGAVYYDGKFKLLLGRTEPVVKVLDIDPEIEPLGFWASGDQLFILCSRRNKLGFAIHNVLWDQTTLQQAHPFALPGEVSAAQGYVNADGVWLCMRGSKQDPTLYMFDTKGRLLNQIPCPTVFDMGLSGKMLFCPTERGVTRFTLEGKITEFTSSESFAGCELFVGSNIYAVAKDAKRVLRLTVA